MNRNERIVVFCSASFVEDNDECSVIQGIFLSIVFQTVSPYTPRNLWPSSCKLVVVLCAVHAYRLCTIVIYNLDSRRRHI